MNVLRRKRVLTKKQEREWLARRPSREDCDLVIDKDAVLIDDDTGEVICRYVTDAISEDARKVAMDCFGEIDKKIPMSVTRRAAAGEPNADAFSVLRDDVDHIEKATATTCHLVLKSGKRLVQPMSNPVKSYLGGYGVNRFNRTTIEHIVKTRMPEEWERSEPFFRAISAAHAKHEPEANRLQSDRIRDTNPGARIHSTAMSTVTINVDYESHYHYDSGDFKDGVSTVVAVGDWMGGELVFPAYGVAVDIQPGGIAFKRSHKTLHGNLAVTTGKRISFVTYLKHALGKAKPM